MFSLRTVVVNYAGLIKARLCSSGSVLFVHGEV